MPVPSRLLGDDEEVLVDLHPHWVFLTGPLLLFGVAVASAVAVVVQFPTAPVVVAWALGALVAMPGLWLAARTVRWMTTSLVVTSDRLVLRRGVLRRDLVQLHLDRISEVHCTQGLFQRLLGTGRLVVELAGGSDAVYLDHVRRPRALQRILNARLEETAADHRSLAPDLPAGGGWYPPAPVLGPDDTPPQGVPLPGPPPPASTTPASSLHQQLIALDDLRQRGIVSEEEFTAKKTDLLSRL